MTSFRSLLNSTSLDDHEQVVEIIDSLDAEAKRALAPVKKKLQLVLHGLAGRRFETLEESQSVARRLQIFFMEWGLRVKCPRVGCKDPTLLYCKQAGCNAKPSFEFVHSIEGKMTTHFSSRSFPAGLVVMDTPPDPRRK